MFIIGYWKLVAGNLYHRVAEVLGMGNLYARVAEVLGIGNW
ncbi:hypothetical protein QUA82_31365 [Microcoleus sp. F8-D3]